MSDSSIVDEKMTSVSVNSSQKTSAKVDQFSPEKMMSPNKAVISTKNITAISKEEEPRLRAYAKASPLGRYWFQCFICGKEPYRLASSRCKKHTRQYEIIWFKNDKDFLDSFDGQY